MQRQKWSEKNVKNINIEIFTQNLKENLIFPNPPAKLDGYVQCYNDSLRGILDKHASSTEKKVVLRPHAPWYIEHIQRAKQERKQAEKRWVKSKVEIYKYILKCKQHVVNDLCKKTETASYNTKVNECANNSKALFRLSNFLQQKSNNNVLPSHTSTRYLENSFGKFPDDKIAKIRCNMNGRKERTIANIDEIPESKLCKIISKRKFQICALSPLPTSLLKVLLPLLLAAIHTIVNRYLGESFMPDALKEWSHS